MLNTNTKARDFTLSSQEGKDISLHDFAGKYVILYFYPKDNTPGCTTEACSIRDSYHELKKYAVVIGISADSVESHSNFADQHQLPFILLSDPKKEVIKLYEAGSVFTKRITYLIDPGGNIIRNYPKVTPSAHASELLSDLKHLTNESAKS